MKLYHPDKSGVSSEEQFQAIGHAYDVLRGKRASGSTSTVDAATQATTASRRAMHVRRHQNLYAGGAVDDSWKDKIILAGVAFVSVLKTSLDHRMPNYCRLSLSYSSRQRPCDKPLSSKHVTEEVPSSHHHHLAYGHSKIHVYHPTKQNHPKCYIISLVHTVIQSQTTKESLLFTQSIAPSTLSTLQISYLPPSCLPPNVSTPRQTQKGPSLSH